MVSLRHQKQPHLGLHLGEHAGDVLVLRGTEDEINELAGEIIVQGLTEPGERVLIVGRVEDDRRLAAHDFEAGGPFYFRKTLLDGSVGYLQAADFERGLCRRGVLDLMNAEQWDCKTQATSLSGDFKRLPIERMLERFIGDSFSNQCQRCMSLSGYAL